MMLSACDDVDDVGISLSKYCRYIFVELETMIMSSKENDEDEGKPSGGSIKHIPSPGSP